MVIGWDIHQAPLPDGYPKYYGCCSYWIAMNCLQLSTELVVCEAKERKMIEFMKSLGMKVLEVPFLNCYEFGGSFHCFSTDIRRRGDLHSYFRKIPGSETVIQPWTPEEARALGWKG